MSNDKRGTERATGVETLETLRADRDRWVRTAGEYKAKLVEAEMRDMGKATEVPCPTCGSNDGPNAWHRRPSKATSVDPVRALLASWLSEGDDGALWSDWPKRLTEDEREALAAAWAGKPAGSCWTRTEGPTPVEVFKEIACHMGEHAHCGSYICGCECHEDKQAKTPAAPNACQTCDQVAGHAGSCVWTAEDLAKVDAEAKKLGALFAAPAAQAESVARPAVVWADDATPFDGAQAKALLDENQELRAMLAATAKHLGIGFEPSADDLYLLRLVPEQTNNVLQSLRRAATGATHTPSDDAYDQARDLVEQWADVFGADVPARINLTRRIASLLTGRAAPSSCQDRVIEAAKNWRRAYNAESGQAIAESGLCAALDGLES